jgi:uncharacterized membrane protein YciS (DUF1049 family)
MKMTIDARQEHKINILLTVVSIIAASATIWWVLNERRHTKMEMEIFTLDKQIKEHQLDKIVSGK